MSSPVGIPAIQMLFPLLGILWLAALLGLYRWSRELAGTGFDTSQRSPRLPGRSLDAALVNRCFELAMWTLALGFIPPYAALYCVDSENAYSASLFAAAAILVIWWSIRKARACIREIGLLRRERESRIVVGQVLARVLPAEFRIFHDVPMNDGVIDHVAVGPNGVFAMDCGTYRPRVDGASEDHQTVGFDGRKLYFPDGPDGGDARPLGAVRRKAEWLREWIAVTSREHVAVQPVLVLVGWRVRGDGAAQGERGSVRVLNEETLDALDTGGRSLQPTVIHRIARRLELRGRPADPGPRTSDQASRPGVTDAGQ